jgi:hypothetical protein
VVRCRGPVRRGAVSLLILRWEAADASGQLFPVLGADITLVPDGKQATLAGLDGVYRALPGADLNPVIAQAAAVTIRSLLGRLAGDHRSRRRAARTPAAPPCGQARWLLPRPDHGDRGNTDCRVAGASGSHTVGSGGPAASSASMNGHRCIRWPLIVPGSISTT